MRYCGSKRRFANDIMPFIMKFINKFLKIINGTIFDFITRLSSVGNIKVSKIKMLISWTINHYSIF